MVVGTLMLVLEIPGADSLKSKRQVLRPVIERLRRFNASVAEVADQERWQVATIGVAVVANQHAFVHEVLDKAFRKVDAFHDLVIRSHEKQVVDVTELDDLDEGPRTLAHAEGLFDDEED